MSEANDLEEVRIPREGKCAICHSPYTNYGHNPEPVLSYPERVCNTCNQVVVIPARIQRIVSRSTEKWEG